MRTIRVTIQGTRPMLMSNARMADPLDPYAKFLKELTAKRKKTDTDHEEIGRAEFVGRLYHNRETGPVIPGDNLFGVIRDGGKKSRNGQSVKETVEILETEVPIEYEGPRDPQAMWDHQNEYGDYVFRDRRGVRQQKSTVIRTRPKIPSGWKATFTVGLAEGTELNPKTVRKCLEDGGARVGVGDFRPRFGQFKVIGWEEI